MIKQSYAIIGLGRFGTSIASKLSEAGQEVLGIDINEDRVEDGVVWLPTQLYLIPLKKNR